MPDSWIVHVSLVLVGDIFPTLGSLKFLNYPYGFFFLRRYLTQTLLKVLGSAGYIWSYQYIRPFYVAMTATQWRWKWVEVVTIVSVRSRVVEWRIIPCCRCISQRSVDVYSCSPQCFKICTYPFIFSVCFVCVWLGIEHNHTHIAILWKKRKVTSNIVRSV